MPWRHPAEPFSDAIIRGFTSALCAARLIFCNMPRLQLTIYMQLTVCSIITYPTYYRQLPPFIFHSDLRFPCLASLCCFTYLHLHIQVREGAKKLFFSRNISESVDPPPWVHLVIKYEAHHLCHPRHPHEPHPKMM